MKSILPRWNEFRSLSAAAAARSHLADIGCLYCKIAAQQITDI
jgi:hypothetical protein